jgi:hypothetical protein
MVQARQGGWAEKRGACRSRTSSKYIEQRADRAATREAEVRDHSIEAIDEAITRFRSGLRATKQVVLADGTIAEPRGHADHAPRPGASDRQVPDPLRSPVHDHEGRSFAATISSEALPLDALQKIVELTRGLVPLPDHTSGLPHIRE